MSAKIISLPSNKQAICRDNDMSKASILQPSASQLNQDRRKYRHAPESAILLGVVPGISSDELTLFKEGNRTRRCNTVTPEPIGDNKAEAILAYQKQTGNQLLPLILKRGTYIAEMDGISEDRQLVLDIQFLGDGYDGHDLREKLRAGVLPEHHKIRLQHMMLVADAQTAHLWLWDEKYRYGELLSVERNEGYFARIFTIWEVFQDRIDRGGSWLK